jgi:hypothetical protein
LIKRPVNKTADQREEKTLAAQTMGPYSNVMIRDLERLRTSLRQPGMWSVSPPPLTRFIAPSAAPATQSPAPGSAPPVVARRVWPACTPLHSIPYTCWSLGLLSMPYRCRSSASASAGRGSTAEVSTAPAAQEPVPEQGAQFSHCRTNHHLYDC